MSPASLGAFALHFAFPVRADVAGKVAAAVLVMVLEGCAPSAERSDDHAADWHDDPVASSRRQRELRLQSDWRGKPYKSLAEAFGEPVSQWNIPDHPPMEAYAVVYGTADGATNCVDTFTLLKVEDSREWVVEDYFCR